MNGVFGIRCLVFSQLPITNYQLPNPLNESYFDTKNLRYNQINFFSFFNFLCKIFPSETVVEVLANII
ncbi:hypothetical protein NIES3275_25080 [Microchaete diplosiphon NIES-3275]|nr:hypothetical protein NIES3275_25080 [Microchaete diplosiphon NIES-3275]